MHSYKEYIMPSYQKVINGLSDLGMHKMQEHLDYYIKAVNSGEKSFSDALEELIEMEKAAGRTRFTKNQLLLECYNLKDCEVKTLDEWHALGYYVKRTEHAYIFWDNNGEPIMKFADWQLQVQQLSLFNNL